MTNPKNNGNGVKEVTPATANKQATAKIPAPVKIQTVKAQEKQEEKPKAQETPTPDAMLPAQPKTLNEQIQYFLGLERLVNIRRRFEAHLEAVQALVIEDEDLSKFEMGNTYSVRIELHDSNRREYNITNPRLVLEMQAHLVSLLKGKIEEYNQQILSYGTTA